MSTDRPRVTIRRERLQDAPAIDALLERAFGEQDEVRLVEALRASAEYIPELSLVAVDGDDIVGQILFSRVIVEGVRPGPAVALAPMAVAPERQRSGIGAALIRAGLDACDALGIGLVVVLGHPSYYPRFGFVPARDLGVLPPVDWPGDAWMALPLQDDHPRGTVRFSAAFDPAM
jgi:putative acetyltransferase